MIYQIKFLKDAKRDIRRMNDYIGEYRAKKVLKNIKNDIKKLKDMPRTHKTIYSSKNPNYEYRRMLSNGYAVIYEVTENQIIILRIFSQKQNYLNPNNFILKEKSANYFII